MSLPNAGWYPDTFDAHLIRWWSGESWTSHVQPAPEPEPVTEAPPASEPTRAHSEPLPVQELVGASLGTGGAPTSSTVPSAGSPASSPALPEQPDGDGPQIFRSGFIQAPAAAAAALAPSPAPSPALTPAPTRAPAHAALPSEIPAPREAPSAPVPAVDEAPAPVAPSTAVQPSWTNGLPPVSTDGSDADLEALYRKRAEQIAAARAVAPHAVDDSAVGSAFTAVRLTPVVRRGVALSMESSPVEAAPVAVDSAPVVAAAAASAPVLDFDALLRSEARPSSAFVADPHLTAAVQADLDGEPEPGAKPRGRRRLVALSLVLAIVALGGCGAYLAPQVAERVWGASPSSTSADDPYSAP